MEITGGLKIVRDTLKKFLNTDIWYRGDVKEVPLPLKEKAEKVLELYAEEEEIARAEAFYLFDKDLERKNLFNTLLFLLERTEDKLIEGCFNIYSLLWEMSYDIFLEVFGEDDFAFFWPFPDPEIDDGAQGKEFRRAFAERRCPICLVCGQELYSVASEAGAFSIVFDWNEEKKIFEGSIGEEIGVCPHCGAEDIGFNEVFRILTGITGF